jgi:hypothetical protein
MSDDYVPSDAVLAHRGNVRRITELVDELRAAADWLEAHAATVPTVYVSSISSTLLSLRCDNDWDLAQCTRWISQGSTISEPVAKSTDDWFAGAFRSFGHVQLWAYAHRDQVCVKVKTGTQLKLVPDPDYPPAPQVQREVDVYEWQCSPLLEADATQP